MSSFSFRPSFSHVLDLPPAEAAEAIRAGVCGNPIPFEVKCFPDFVCVRIPHADRHFWTPRLMLSLEPLGDGRTVVHGTYGPNENVWGLIFYGYLLLGVGGVFSGIFGFSQWRLDLTPWGLWVFWTLAGLAAALYLTAQMGQKLAAQQTFTLHQAYERAVGQSVKVR